MEKSFSCFSIAAKNQSIRHQKSMENILELSNTVKQALFSKSTHLGQVAILLALLEWRILKPSAGILKTKLNFGRHSSRKLKTSGFSAVIYIKALIRRESERLGIDLIGFSKMQDAYILRSEWKDYLKNNNFNYVISLAAAISVTSCDQLLSKWQNGGLFYFDKHNKAVANELDLAAERLCLFIEKQGYLALHIPGLGTAFSDGGCKTIISHMTHARLAGLGTMSDSGMLITKEYGPRVRLTSIITNCPLPSLEMLPDDLCIHCGLCQRTCPSGSIKGEHFDINQPERIYLNRAACEAHRADNKEKYGTRLCNLCMAVCPIGEDKKTLKK